jgi:hypothetical protein
MLVGIGLWFHLDTHLFTPLSYGRENRRSNDGRTADVLIGWSRCGERHGSSTRSQKGECTDLVTIEP